MVQGSRPAYLGPAFVLSSCVLRENIRSRKLASRARDVSIFWLSPRFALSTSTSSRITSSATSKFYHHPTIFSISNRSISHARTCEKPASFVASLDSSRTSNLRCLWSSADLTALEIASHMIISPSDGGLGPGAGGSWNVHITLRIVLRPNGARQ